MCIVCRPATFDTGAIFTPVRHGATGSSASALQANGESKMALDAANDAKARNERREISGNIAAIVEHR
jgi:hypothetical protein